jgi:hypothetical protein
MNFSIRCRYSPAPAELRIEIAEGSDNGRLKLVAVVGTTSTWLENAEAGR